MNERILVISDLHSPYFHQDTVPFLRAIKAKYKPDTIVCVGDVFDLHSVSFHDHDPDLPSPGPELQEAIHKVKPIYRMFPYTSIMESNHDSLIFRRAISAGLPRAAIKPYNDIFNAPKGWKWRKSIVLTASDGRDIYFVHGKSKVASKLSKNMSMSTVEGHFHSSFGVAYWSNPRDIFWSAHVGCLIDDGKYSFAYNKTDLERPLIGCGIIINGQMKLLPMILRKGGKWKGRLV